MKPIKSRFDRQMELWFQAQFTALVDDTINYGQEGRGGLGQGVSMEAQEEHAAKAYNHTLLNGKIRQEVQRTMIREVVGVLVWGDACTNTGNLTREVIQ